MLKKKLNHSLFCIIHVDLESLLSAKIKKTVKKRSNRRDTKIWQDRPKTIRTLINFAFVPLHWNYMNTSFQNRGRICVQETVWIDWEKKRIWWKENGFDCRKTEKKVENKFT